MTMYKATVRNKQTYNYEVISGEYSSKKAFIEDLRRNGYAVNQQLQKDRFKENKYTAIQKATEIYQAFQIAAGADLVREELTK